MVPFFTLFLIGLAIFASAAPSNAPDASSKPLDPTGQSGIEEVLAKRKTITDQIAALTAHRDVNSTDADPTDVSTAEDELEFKELTPGL